MTLFLILLALVTYVVCMPGMYALFRWVDRTFGNFDIHVALWPIGIFVLITAAFVFLVAVIIVSADDLLRGGLEKFKADAHRGLM